MPELPDVETLKRCVDSTSLHRSIRKAEVDASRMLHGVSARQLRKRLLGSKFDETARHGKFLLIKLSKGQWLFLHFGMTGTLEYSKRAAERPEHARLLVDFDNGYRLAGIWQRRLGRIGLTESPRSLARSEALGPDALDPDLDLGAFMRMLRGRRGGVKSALMDQQLIAGIGNIYSDEMLFQSRIRPDAKASGLSEERMAALHRAMRHVLKTATERQADPAKIPDTWLLPHRYQGAKCPHCGGVVRRMSAVGRTAYYCARCQKRT